MARHTSMQSRVLRSDWKPETWMSSQYWEYRPSVTIRMVRSTSSSECPFM